MISGNEFSGLRQGSCTTHSDPIQFYGAEGTVVDGNYFHDNSTAIMTPDGNGDNTTVRNNVFVMDEYPWAYVGGGDVGSKLTHNVVVGGSLRIYGGNQNQASRDTVLRDNVSVIEASGTNITVDHNMQPNQVTFMGGSGRNAYLLANSSAGKGAASDGLDVGILSGSTAPAPPPPASDTTAPETTIASGPTGTTNDNTPTFAFSSSKANSVFECRVDSGSWVNCASPWTTAALSDAAHSVSVRATDVAGNTDASPATRAFTVDTTPPADTTPPDTTITSGPANPTTSTSASFAFTSSESGSTFECKLDAAAYAACTSPKAYSGLSTGSHSFSVRAKDAAGNTDASPATQSWTIQSAPPPDHQPVAAYVYSPTAPATGQAVTFDASSATCDDAPCSYSWADDGDDGPGGTQWPLGSGKTMTFTFQDAGVKNVRLVITDADGDTNAIMKAITVTAAAPSDTTPPDTTITSSPTNTTSDNTPTFAFTSSDPKTFDCRIDSGP